MQPAPQQPAESLPRTVEHQAFRRCPFCAEPILAQAVRCKHCHASLAAPSKGLLIATQIVCGFETAILIIVTAAASAMTGMLSTADRVEAGLAALTGGVLFYFIMRRRPWAFLAMAALHALCLINHILQVQSGQIKSPLLGFVMWSALAALAALAWRESRKSLAWSSPKP